MPHVVCGKVPIVTVICQRCGREREHDARGMCHTCIEYLRRHGQLAPIQRWKFDPDAAGGPFALGDPRLPPRFWAKVEVSPSGCWRWTATTNHGYGVFKAPEIGTKYAHRAAYLALVGPLSAELGLDHLCHTRHETCHLGDLCPHRACCNPDHLEPVPLLTNVRRGHGNGAKTHCPQGHEYTEENTIQDKSGGRRCKNCTYERNRQYKLSKRS